MIIINFILIFITLFCPKPGYFQSIRMAHYMKKQIREILRERLEKINKYLRKTEGRFHSDSIHSFRLEVKKLQSFLEMISPNGNTLSVPKKLKKLYRILGSMRLVQLQRQAILETTSRSHTGIPAHYSASLETERCIWKKKAKSHIKTMKRLKVKNFGMGVPDKIAVTAPRKFLTQQENLLSAIFHLPDPDEKTLHEARKILKCILYDLPYVKNSNRIKRKSYDGYSAQMKLLESKIGDFHDVSTSIRSLGEALNDSYEMEEKHILTFLRNQWKKDKEDLKSQITDLGLTLSKRNRPVLPGYRPGFAGDQKLKTGLV
jgi:CHAD domain-containing protein